MTNTYTQAEVGQLIATTRRETVEGIAQIMAQTFDEMGVVSDEKVIADSYLRKLDQLPDKREVLPTQPNDHE